MSDEPAAIMIFAAGFGTRMGALTRTRPKPLIQVAGKALIDHALDLARPAGLPIIVNTHYRADMMEQHLAGVSGVKLSHETPDILETGGALKHALPLMPAGPTMTLNSDAVWAGPNPLQILRAAWDGSRMEALLLLIPQGNCAGRSAGGDFTAGPDGVLRRDKAGLVYTGAHIIKTARLALAPEAVFSLNVIWDEMIADGTAFAAHYPGRWADVGTPDGITAAEDMLARV